MRKINMILIITLTMALTLLLINPKTLKASTIITTEEFQVYNSSIGDEYTINNKTYELLKVESYDMFSEFLFFEKEHDFYSGIILFNPNYDYYLMENNITDGTIDFYNPNFIWNLNGVGLYLQTKSNSEPYFNYYDIYTFNFNWDLTLTELDSNIFLDMYEHHNHLAGYSYHILVSEKDFSGYDLGYNDGLVYGREDGFSDGYDTGKQFGYDLGYNKGRDDFGKYFPPGSPDGLSGWYGFDDGYDYGLEIGFDIGFESAADNSFYGIIYQVFFGISTFLAIEILPNITFGAILAVPLVFGIISFIIGKSRRKDD